MKRILTVSLILTFCLLLMTVPAFATYNAATNTVSMNVPFSPPQITPSHYGPDYSHVEMDGARSLGEVGEPVLPVKGVKVLIPPNTKVKNVFVTLGEKISLPVKFRVEPGQQDYRIDQIGQIAIIPDKPNPDIYSADLSYPSKQFEFESTQQKMGYSIATIKVFPVEYNPVKQILSYYKNITVKIKLEATTAMMSSQSPQIVPRLRTVLDDQEKDKAAIQRFVDNDGDLVIYDDILLNNAEAMSGAAMTTMGPITPNPKYKYCIITKSSFVAEFERLKLRRTQNGLPATIVTTDWIFSNYPGTRPDGGTDNQTKIRNFIIDAYNVWGTRYVLLAGDGDGEVACGETGDNTIPARMMIDQYGNIDSIPADLYYSCLDGTFDNDADGLYGEANDGIDGGEVDLVAEVYVGRASVDSLAEVRNFVDKTLAYEDSSDSYLNNSYMVGEKLGEEYYATDDMEQIRLGSGVDFKTQGFMSNPDLAWDADTLYDSPQKEWSTTKLMTIINNGVHILNHLGHSDVNYVMKLSNFDARQLNNTKYFIGYSQGCFPGAFDNINVDLKYECEDSIAENLTTKANGAVAFVANSRFGWINISQIFNRQFWDALFFEGIRDLGKMNQDSKEDNIAYMRSSPVRECYYQQNLFGDPALSIHLPSSLAMSVVSYSFEGSSLADMALFIKLKAYNVNALNVAAVLSSDDPNIIINNGSSSYGMISKGQAVKNTIPYKISFKELPQGKIMFNLAITANGYIKNKTISVAVVDPKINRITSDSADQINPSISGDWILWDDFRYNKLDISIYNIPSKVERRMTSGDSSPSNAMISDNRVVFQDWRNGNLDIYLYDLTNNTERQITADSDFQFSPYISGNRIVWSDWRNGNPDIYMFDLETNSVRQITTDSATQHAPVISGNLIAWLDKRDGNDDIFLYDLSTNTESRITADVYNQKSVSIAGDNIVWEDDRNGNADIYTYELTTRTLKQITEDERNQTQPFINNNRIVWIDELGNNKDIYVYNFADDSIRQVTANSGENTAPALSGNRVVWSKFDDRNWDIYMYDLTDTTPPITPVVADMGAFTLAENGLAASWSSGDPESDIAQYKYQITQDSITGAVVRNWTSTGQTASVIVTDLTLEHKKKYFFSVKAKNAAGLWSEAGYSDGILVDFHQPTVGTITPAAGSGTPPLNVNFAAVYKDLDGWQDMKGAWLLINTKINGANCGYFYYNQNTNKLYLRNEDNTAWLGGFAPGSANTIENSKVRLNCANTTVTGSGNFLTITWGVRLKAAFLGTELKNLYLYARDDLGANSGWVKKGTYQLGSGTQAPAEDPVGGGESEPPGEGE